MSSTGVYDNGVKQQVQSSDPAVKVRLHQGAGGTYVWVVNPTKTVRTVKVSLPTTFKEPPTSGWSPIIPNLSASLG